MTIRSAAKSQPSSRRSRDLRDGAVGDTFTPRHQHSAAPSLGLGRRERRDAVKTKPCTKCGVELPLESFHRMGVQRGKLRRRSDCSTCRAAYRRAYRRQPETLERNRHQRAEVLTHYSGFPAICRCCGEREEAFLVIDHINGGGARQRRELGGGSSKFYRWLKSAGFPGGFQVLCHNCNMAKSTRGECPHEKERRGANVQQIA